VCPHDADAARTTHKQVSLGHSAALERRFGCPGPFWGRTYLFWHGGAPLTLIHEVFSNSLAAHLGPQTQGGGS
jgi:chorismate lyase